MFIKYEHFSNYVNITLIQVYALTNNAEGAEVEWFYEWFYMIF